MANDWKRIRDAMRHFPGYRCVRFLYRLMRSAESRNIAWLEWRRPDGLFQPFPTTSADRYPKLFALAHEQIGDGSDRRILSFGCATGEEVWSLRRCFPSAEIVGIDISPRNIALCRRRLRSNPDLGLRFEIASSVDGEDAESFDAIFAMAVFRHGGLTAESPPSRCDSVIRFARFDQATTSLARCLKPGGLLFIKHAQFRFSETAAYRDFEVIVRAEGVGRGPVYGQDDRLLPGVVYNECVFRKRTQPTNADP